MKTCIGELRLRQEVPSHGTNENGDFLFLSIVPDSQTDRWFGEYLYAKISDPERIERQDRYRWIFRHFPDKEFLIEERAVTAGSDWLHMPQHLEKVAEGFAREYGCDVLIRVKREELNPYPGSKEVAALWFEISIFKLPQIQNVQRFLRGLCSRIDRITREYDLMMEGASMECI